MLLEIAQTFVATCRDVFPVLALIAGFQFIILRQPIPHLRQVVGLESQIERFKEEVRGE